MKANKLDLHQNGRLYTKEEFIEKIKTDDEFAKRWGELGPIYGHQWRHWGEETDDMVSTWAMTNNREGIDQVSELIRLLKDSPDSRRMIVNAWNPTDLPNQVLPPCHYGFQCYTRELSGAERAGLMDKKLVITKEERLLPYLTPVLLRHNIPTRAISLMVNIRSSDVFLGLPFNIASYGLLLLMLADEVNMIPDELIVNLGDTHLYLNHLDQAKEQIGRELTISERIDMVVKKPKFDPFDFGIGEVKNKKRQLKHDHKVCDAYNVPRRTREPFELPTVKVQDGMFCSSTDDVILLNYQSHPKIEAPLSN